MDVSQSGIGVPGEGMVNGSCTIQQVSDTKQTQIPCTSDTSLDLNGYAPIISDEDQQNMTTILAQLLSEADPELLSAFDKIQSVQSTPDLQTAQAEIPNCLADLQQEIIKHKQKEGEAEQAMQQNVLSPPSKQVAQTDPTIRPVHILQMPAGQQVQQPQQQATTSQLPVMTEQHKAKVDVVQSKPVMTGLPAVQHPPNQTVQTLQAQRVVQLMVNGKPQLMLIPAELAARLQSSMTQSKPGLVSTVQPAAPQPSPGSVATSGMPTAAAKQQTYVLGGQNLAGQTHGIQLIHIPGQPPVAQRVLLTGGQQPLIVPNANTSNKQSAPVLMNSMSVSSPLSHVTSAPPYFSSPERSKPSSHTLQSQTHLVLSQMVSTTAVSVPQLAVPDVNTLPTQSLNSHTQPPAAPSQPPAPSTTPTQQPTNNLDQMTSPLYGRLVKTNGQQLLVCPSSDPPPTPKVALVQSK